MAPISELIFIVILGLSITIFIPIILVVLLLVFFGGRRCLTCGSRLKKDNDSNFCDKECWREG